MYNLYNANMGFAVNKVPKYPITRYLGYLREAT